MSTSLSRAILSVSFTALLVGCSSSGQTGSSDCDVPSTCACNSLLGRFAYRALVVRVHDGEVELEIQESYSPDEPGSRPPPGTLVTGPFSVGPIHCSAVSDRAEPGPGDTVFAAVGAPADDIWLVPWSDPLDLGDRQVALESLSGHANWATCDADLPQEPCDDVIETTSACSIGAPSAARGHALAAFGVAAAILVFRRVSARGKRRLNPRPSPRS